MEIDLHGWHPDDIDLGAIIRQAWEMGEISLKLIHGHGFDRETYRPMFANTNTGFFGLRVRSELRGNRTLRQWIKYTTIDVGEIGATSIKLKANPEPTRTEFDFSLLPEPTYGRGAMRRPDRP